MAKYEALSVSVGGRPALSFRLISSEIKTRRITVVYNSAKEVNVALDFAKENFIPLTDKQLDAVLAEVRRQSEINLDPILEF